MHTLPQRGVTADSCPASHERLDLKAVCEFFGGTRPIDPSTLYRNIAKGLYPAPIKVSPGSSRWLRSECEAAMQAIIEARRTA
jgi:predicted DNA-binding transcriptional regulator AlpA